MRALFNKSHVTNISAGQGFLKDTVFGHGKENKKKATLQPTAITKKPHSGVTV